MFNAYLEKRTAVVVVSPLCDHGLWLATSQETRSNTERSRGEDEHVLQQIIRMWIPLQSDLFGLLHAANADIL